MTWDWIAGQLDMGAPGAVANRLRSDQRSWKCGYAGLTPCDYFGP